MQPNILFVMTDQERYPPPYEDAALAQFRRSLEGHERIRQGAVELHRHYAAATACTPSRTSLFTGHYPSLHGVDQTGGLAKSAYDPAVTWLDPDAVPTMGDWFRAAGYRTEYRGKWHISHADLLATGSHTSLRTLDRDGVVDEDVLDAYRRASRLEGFGFAGWIGREPHGAYLGDTGLLRDPVLAGEAEELFADLRDETRPWLTVISLVNPHDIAFSTLQQGFGFPEPDDTVPGIAPAPSQADSLDGRPRVQAQFRDLWPQMLLPQPADEMYRRFYYWLHALADHAVVRVLDALEAQGLADDTIVVFTSDHGELLGAHGGLQQKWHQAYDEAIRVPLYVRGPGIDAGADAIAVATSHVDLLPTLLGLAGIDAESAFATVAEHHVEAHQFVGRDLSGLFTGATAPDAVDEPIYFMTEDHVSRGDRQYNILTQEPFDDLDAPSRVESVLARIATGVDGAPELWKVNRYFEDLHEERADDEWELHNLTRDPEERVNLAPEVPAELPRMQAVLELTRTRKRLTPRFVPQP